FLQLQEQSDAYRGEIVTVGGTVERIIPQNNPPENAAGIKKFYEIWIRPDGSRLPIVAVCLELPPDYPSGKSPGIDITGFFYKRLGYASAEPAAGDSRQTGLKNVFRSSPLVLAKTVQVRAAPPVAAAKPVHEGPDFLAGVPLPI